MSPQKVPGAPAYFCSLVPDGQETMSDLMRIAATRNCAEFPLIALQRK